MNLDEYNAISGSVDFNKLLVPTPPKWDADSIMYGYEIPSSLPISWIQSFYDAPGGFNEEMREIMISGGLEYWYRQQFAIRGGYFHEHPPKATENTLPLG